MYYFLAKSFTFKNMEYILHATNEGLFDFATLRASSETGIFVLFSFFLSLSLSFSLF